MGGRRGVVVAALLAAAAIAVSRAAAHPHVWVEVTVEVVFDDAGRLAEVREHWLFDANLNADMAVLNDLDRNGVLSDEEAGRAIANNMGWIPYFDYFTRITSDGEAVEPAPASRFEVSFVEDRFRLDLTLPIAAPFAIGDEAGVDVFDIQYYYAIDFAPDFEPRAVNLPEGCTITRREKGALDAQAANLLRQLGLPGQPAARDAAAGHPARIVVTC